ncbi:hypothetical protein NPIL_553941, partial [Nephila pilipes]
IRCPFEENVCNTRIRPSILISRFYFSRQVHHVTITEIDEETLTDFMKPGDRSRIQWEDPDQKSGHRIPHLFL